MCAGSVDKPNILILMADQHNAGVAGCYGDPVVKTPNIDRLAREGLRFDSCYCPSPICVPSRMSFVSGRRPSENNVVDNCDILSSAIVTWPEWLRDSGYHTALIGRMHFEGPDQWHGFETTYEELRHWRGNRPVRYQETTDRVPNGGYWSPRESIEQIAGSGTTFVQYRDEVVTRFGSQFLREQAATAATRPFAAVVGWYNPHPPYIGRRDLYDYYYDRVSVPEDSLASMPAALAEFFGEFRDWERPRLIDQEAKRRAIAAYYANVEHADEQVGRILATLEETGLADSTLVIYTADHGDMIGRHGGWGKVAMFDDSARIPFVARMPGVISAGGSTAHNCNLRDVGNTLCEMIGADPVPGSDAPSRWALFRGAGAPGPDTTESEIVQRPAPFGTFPSVAFKMVTEGPWKLWAYQLGHRLEFSLFNRAEDPNELTDRIKDPSCSKLVSRMKEQLLANWDPQEQIRLAAKRREDRTALDKLWMKDWLHAGYPVPENLDADVDSPHTARMG